jgi:hypothetical protein
MEVFPLEHLKQLFRDAIGLTRRLRIHYIWIDSFCIIQDSKADWAQESAMMGDVYKHCWCNISATGFPDGQAGFMRSTRSILSAATQIQLGYT